MDKESRLGLRLSPVGTVNAGGDEVREEFDGGEPIDDGEGGMSASAGRAVTGSSEEVAIGGGPERSVCRERRILGRAPPAPASISTAAMATIPLPEPARSSTTAGSVETP